MGLASSDPDLAELNDLFTEFRFLRRMADIRGPGISSPYATVGGIFAVKPITTSGNSLLLRDLGLKADVYNWDTKLFNRLYYHLYEDVFK